MERALGFDVSHYHPVADWDAIPTQYRFVGFKASEGNTNVDQKLAYHRDAVRARPGRFDLVVYYHVARPGDAVAQASRFVGLLGQLQPNERLALDTERTSAVPPQYIADFLDALPNDRRKILYTSTGVWMGPFMNNPPFPAAAEVDLWLPRYGDLSPVVPQPWQQIGKDWTIWQDSEKGSVPGVGDEVDMNVFNGTDDDLRAYAAL